MDEVCSQTLLTQETGCKVVTGICNADRTCAMSTLLQKNLKSIRIELIQVCEEILELHTFLPKTELE